MATSGKLPPEANGFSAASRDARAPAPSDAPELAPFLAESFVQAMETSPSFNTTDVVWRYLRLVRELSPTQCGRLIDAAAGNSQIRNAQCPDDPRGRAYPDVIREFVERQASFS